MPSVGVAASPNNHMIPPPPHQPIGVSPPHGQINNLHAPTLNATPYTQFPSPQAHIVGGGGGTNVSSATAPILMQIQANNLSPLSGQNTSKLRLVSNNVPAITSNTPTNDLSSQARARKIVQERYCVLESLVRYQEEFDSPREEDIKSVPPCIDGKSESQFKHFTEMTILSVKLIVEFAKKVYGFETLTRSDQITLLKACASELLMLSATKRYDIKTDSILFVNNQPFNRENYRKAHIGGIADALFNFCRSTVILRLDAAEYALINALIIFSERPNLGDPEKVEKIQEFYLDLLQAYVELHEQVEKCKFARLLSLLAELRSLGVVNNNVCFSLKIKKCRLPDFLAEIWDVDQEEYSDED